MINFYNQVPTVYNNTSRDFQYLSWLINIVLNSVKHNVDDLYSLPSNTTDIKLTELLALTLGFKVKRNYDKNQLAALVSVIPNILKNKGNIQAVTIAANALLNASAAVGSFDYTIDDGCLKVTFPKELVDITLFLDLLPYILPAGMTCRVIRKTQIKPRIHPIEVKYRDTLHAKLFKDLAWDFESKTTTGLTNLFEAGVAAPEFANYKQPVAKDPETKQPILNLNAGLLDNTMIPVLDAPLNDLNDNNNNTEVAPEEGNNV